MLNKHVNKNLGDKKNLREILKRINLESQIKRFREKFQCEQS